MTEKTKAKRLARFRQLDRLFWLVWLGLPLMVWLSLAAAADPAALAAQLPAELAQCARLIPQPEQMSGLGKVLYWFLLGYQLSIYVVLLAALHRVVHRFAQGRLYAAETLSIVGWLGVVLVAWPFTETAVTGLVAYGLKALGDIPILVPSLAVDIAPITVGLFLIALRSVLTHAMAIEAENELTI